MKVTKNVITNKNEVEKLMCWYGAHPFCFRPSSQRVDIVHAMKKVIDSFDDVELCAVIMYLHNERGFSANQFWQFVTVRNVGKKRREKALRCLHMLEDKDVNVVLEAC